MTLALLDDSSEFPLPFDWRGPVDPAVLSDWLEQNPLWPTPELIELWLATGGGDFFESETILFPFGGHETGDNVVELNHYHHSRGLSDDFMLFYTGAFGLGVVEKRTGDVVVLTEEDYRERFRFKSLDDLYLELIRPEFAERYGLRQSS